MKAKVKPQRNDVLLSQRASAPHRLLRHHLVGARPGGRTKRGPTDPSLTLLFPLQAGGDARQPLGEARIPKGERGEDLVRPRKGRNGLVSGLGDDLGWARLWG